MKNPNIPEWARAIENYAPGDEREAAEQRIMLDLIAQYGDKLLSRESAFAHFTASSIIVNAARTHTLMAYHKIYNSWAWTGGHADGERDFLQTALREAREETGIEGLRVLRRDFASLEVLPVWAHVKRGRAVGSHLHLNLSFLFEADDSLPLRANPGENTAVAWLPVDALANRVSEPDMLPVYRRLLMRCGAIREA